jgi:hypothetical protein
MRPGPEVALVDAVGGRCTVLLAPPAAGKSTELRAFVETQHGRAGIVSLGEGGDVEREIGAMIAGLGERSTDAGEAVTLVLDSLDESMLAAPERAGLMKRTARRLAANTRLVLACRTAAWLPGVQYTLSEMFGTDVVTLDLVPLTAEDAAAYATAAGHDGDSFLKAVTAARALPLVQHPKELEWLFDAYVSGAELPTSQQDLYEQAVRRQAVERNPHRQTPLQPVNVPAMLHTAGRMAVLSLFTGRSTFVLWDSGTPNDLTLEHCAPPPSLEEEDDDGRYTSCATVLATSLFTGETDGRLRFTHQTVAEYLAARYLVRSDLRPAQLDGLLRGRGGQLAPQVQAVAAWLVALRPDRFAELLDDDPLAFIRSNVELTDPTYRQALVERLLKLADTHSLIDLPYRQLEGLTYDGIEDFLREELVHTTRSLDARYLTIQLIGKNHLVALNDALLQVALAEDEPVVLRNAAGLRSLDLVPPTSAANPLAVLAQPAAARRDEDDELLGVGLRALLLASASPDSLLTLLRIPSNPDMIGNYFMFVKRDLPAAFERRLDSSEVCHALTWLCEFKPGSSRRSESFTEELEDAIVSAGLRELDDPVVRTHVVRTIAVRLTNMQELFHRREMSVGAIREDSRRSLVLQLQQDVEQPHLPWWLRDWELIRPDDFGWLAELAAGTTEPSRWEPWLRATYDGDRHDHRGVIDAHPDLGELALPIPRPVPRRHTATEDDGEEVRLTDAELRTRLYESIAGAPADAFIQFFLFAPLRSRHTASELDIKKLPGWAALDNDQRRKTLDIAERYLQVGTENGAALLGTDRTPYSALAALAALILLEAERNTFILSRDRWAFWAPAIVHGPHFHNVEEQLGRLLGVAHHEAPEAVREAIELEVRGRGEFGQFTLQRLVGHLDDADVPWLMRFLNDHGYDEATASVAFERILRLNPGTAQHVLKAAFQQETAGDAGMSSRTQRLVAVMLMGGCQPAWPMIREALTGDDDATTSIFLGIANDRSFNGAAFSESEVIEVWELLQRLFPPAEDPVEPGVHVVSPREAVGHMRNRLLTSLAERGTNDAVMQLQLLSHRFPDEPAFSYLVAQARAARGRADWAPLEPAQVHVVLSTAKRVLRNDDDLLDVVLEALDQAQEVLQAATPLATLLWNHIAKCVPRASSTCRPKTEDEISDFLDYMISSAVSGAVVNREVQVARMQTSGVGQRADLLIQAQAANQPGRVLRVVIEVKGCWNPEIVDALELQLVQRYLLRWPSSAGLFLVAWFDPAHGFKAGTWRTDSIRGNRERLKADLEDRAGRAAAENARAVRAFVLDCSMPSEAGAAT